MQRKMSWRSLKFIPEGGDESQAITRKSKGFMHLCEIYRYHPEKFSGYTIHDTKGMFVRYGPNNVDVRWSDFRQALIRYEMNAPPEKPSMFRGEWYPPEHTIRMRKRVLAAVMREYISPQALAEDVLEWLWRGRDEDTRKFVVTLMHRVGWLRETPTTLEAAQTTPVQRVENEVLLMADPPSSPRA